MTDSSARHVERATCQCNRTHSCLIHSFMQHDSFKNMTHLWLIHMCDMPSAQYVNETWLIRDSFKCATCRACIMLMRHDSFNDICSCDMTHSRTELIRDSFKCATCRTCNISHNMTRSFWILLVRHYSFIRVTCHIHICNTNHVHAWYITHVGCHMWNITHIYDPCSTCDMWYITHM